MANNLTSNPDYKSWLSELKGLFRQTQQKAAVKVNSALLMFYWQVGSQVVEKQKTASWGDGFLKQLSHDLMTEFPNIKGFSTSNINYMRQWVLFFSHKDTIDQQPVGQSTQNLVTRIPWGHNLKIIDSQNLEVLSYGE
jgi:hypothetical protein